MDCRHKFAKELRRNMTDAEQLLWRQLRGRRFVGHKFRRQHPLGPYIVDFVSLADGLIIEADGGQHNASEADKERDAWLAAHGFRLLRFWNDDILVNTEVVLQAVWNELECGDLHVNPHPNPSPKGRGA